MPKFTSSLNLPQYATAPATAANGDVYYNTTDNKVYSRINGAWVDLAAGGGSGNVVYYQATAPTSPSNGDIWVESDNDITTNIIPTASTSTAGIVQLTDSVSSSSTTTAATANSVKTVSDSAEFLAYIFFD